jgi:hypothetical protein
MRQQPLTMLDDKTLCAAKRQRLLLSSTITDYKGQSGLYRSLLPFSFGTVEAWSPGRRRQKKLSAF